MQDLVKWFVLKDVRKNNYSALGAWFVVALVSMCSVVGTVVLPDLWESLTLPWREMKALQHDVGKQSVELYELRKVIYPDGESSCGEETTFVEGWAYSQIECDSLPPAWEKKPRKTQ